MSSSTTFGYPQRENASAKYYSRCSKGMRVIATPSLAKSVKSNSSRAPGLCNCGKKPCIDGLEIALQRHTRRYSVRRVLPGYLAG